MFYLFIIYAITFAFFIVFNARIKLPFASGYEFPLRKTRGSPPVWVSLNTQGVKVDRILKGNVWR